VGGRRQDFVVNLQSAQQLAHPLQVLGQANDLLAESGRVVLSSK